MVGSVPRHAAGLCRPLVFLVLAAGITTSAALSLARERWTEDEALAWQQKHPWLVGCNYNPRTAINQLEMWQADTFDPETIDQELGWAEDLGFNSVRVFLHDQAFEQDSQGFLSRFDRFLEICDAHHIGVMVVLLDGVWDPHPQPGPQRAPRPHVHNSGWVQSPGAQVLADPDRWETLARYVRTILGRYAHDRRIHAWDLFNEPDNPNTNSYGQVELADKAERAEALLRQVIRWAREANPQQPLTMGVWRGNWQTDEKMSSIDRLMTSESDVISFHTYDPLPLAKHRVASLRRFNRPLLCTEFMARPNGSRFDPQLGYFHDEQVGAYCWGFVAGKTQTNYPWDSWQKNYTAEPAEWFHEIFRPDGSPYRQDEVDYIRRVTSAGGK